MQLHSWSYRLAPNSRIVAAKMIGQLPMRDACYILTLLMWGTRLKLRSSLIDLCLPLIFKAVVLG